MAQLTQKSENMLLQRANQTCLKLYRDESGVVLALSVVSFLILFVVSCAAYAIGETVRQRIELQNAADAAAYSGAVVQADTLARIAAINRAMAWSHVMVARMEMDAIVDKWLELTVDQWEDDETTITNYNMPSCNKIRPVALWNGISQAEDRRILLNQNHSEFIHTIRAARMQAAAQGKSYEALRPLITEKREAIQDMNQTIEALIEDLNDRIEQAVEEVVRANLEENFNDRLAGGAGIDHVCLLGEGYFRVLENNLEDETRFFTHGGFDRGPRETLGRGADVWFVRDPSVSEGLARRYQQTGQSLVANWNWYSSIWQNIEGVCTLISAISGSSEVQGIFGYDREFYETGTSKPQVLTEEFFGRDGAIVIGVRRRLNNPFAFLFQGGQPGVFNAFSPPGGERWMWTASAARAGFRPPTGNQEGEYEVTFEDDRGKIMNKDEMWNLQTSDWDAVLLSLHRAWADGLPGRQWQGETAAEILSVIEGRLGVGGQAAPPGMAGGAFSAGGAENWTMH